MCDAEDDSSLKGQAELLHDHLTCPKTLMRFTHAEGLGMHTAEGAKRVAYGYIYDWLDETLHVA